jgi:predicted nucleic acid-binding protein
VNAAAPFGGRVYLADKSAWSWADRLPDDTRREWQEAITQGLIATSPIAMLEILYSATSAANFEMWRQRLAALPVYLPPNRRICQLALDAYAQLAEKGQHRGVSLPDVVLAATAHTAGIGVLHYDSDFDRLSSQTSLNFESRWIAPRGSIS